MTRTKCLVCKKQYKNKSDYNHTIEDPFPEIMCFKCFRNFLYTFISLYEVLEPFAKELFETFRYLKNKDKQRLLVDLYLDPVDFIGEIRDLKEMRENKDERRISKT